MTPTTFEVKKYVLPTHSIKIEIPRKISFATQKSFQIKLIAAYTFGEFVEGEAIVTFSVYKWSYNPSTSISSQVRKALFTKTVVIDSAAEVIDVSFENDLKITYAQTIYVSVKFTESLTRKVIEAEKTLNLDYQPYELIYSGDDTYVENQTIEYKVTMRNIETGEPVRFLSHM